MKFSLIFFAVCCCIQVVSAQQPKSRNASAWLAGDTLFIENQFVKHHYAWNGGNVMLMEMSDKRTGKSLTIHRPKPDLLLLEEGEPTDASLAILRRQTNPFELYHTAVEIRLVVGGVNVKRVISIYDESPGIRHAFYFRGYSKQDHWEWASNNGRGMIEQRDAVLEALPRIGIIPFDDKHWRFRAVSFREATDHHDNPVLTQTFFNYRQKGEFSANILVVSNTSKDAHFFVIKESPIAYSQAHYPGFDFQVDHEGLTIHGLGVSPSSLSEEWLRGYGYAIGLTGAEAWQQSADLIAYQKKIRQFVPARDGMLLSNTWGDRNKDSRMTEAFILAEIERASELGVTHLQLDDGWQQGLSRNSANQAGVKWDNWSPADWQPHAQRFPNGLDPIVGKAQEHDIEVCLWFNPSKENDYEGWERDADILIGYYRDFGICVFKIDGMELASHAAEQNLRKLFGKVMEETGGEAVFNMDVTAGQRIGYHFFQEFGNVFLENRYTDWGNYYPYRTLRNLWLLSAYMPAERLQIEFLNVLRNRGAYGDDDLLAPHKVGLPYAFGVAMGAQPLAWMELTGLDEDQRRLRELIASYHTIAGQLHASTLIPIGAEPDGFSWTGFFAVHDGQPHFLIVYREAHEEDETILELPIGVSEIEFLFGDTPRDYKLVDGGDALQLALSGTHQFAVFRLE